MYTQYLDSLTLWSEKAEVDFIVHQQATCYNGIYPFKVFLNKDLQKVELAPITIFYGSNGSGKTTLLNIIAEKARVTRHSSFSGGAFFDDYVHGCRLSGRSVPENSEILTSDDVFDYLLDVRGLNDGLDVRREELIQEYFSRKRKVIGNSLSEHPVPVHALRDYEEWKEDCAAANKKGSVSQFVNDRMMKNIDMYSNGESAMRFFVDHITEGALYLLDEPENSLSISLQQDLCEYITASARYFGCQFIIATHSPVLLSMENALIYDLDEYPIKTKKWTELENVRKYFDFFESHRAEFLPNKADKE